ncbi:hypothetical protein [Gephyromycinifex aptenodytis]|uniref:hypothetical protein n=1 Tax=Gephyromycinifex aptenodytis TaxID=2716227 RepID=UPI001D018EAD|nr:hypothetical protein [Gephyromycinifex aptenodytis]
MAFRPYVEQVAIPVSRPGSLVAEVTPQGQRVTHVLLKYPHELLGIEDLRSAFEVKVKGFPGADPVVTRNIVEAYSSFGAQVGSPSAGRYVVIKLDVRDSASSVWGSVTSNEDKIEVAEGVPGSIKKTSIRQPKKSPVPLEGVTYTVTQVGHLTTAEGDDVPPFTTEIALDSQRIFDPALSEFSPGKYDDKLPKSQPLRYQLRVSKKKNAPLVVFLHGSGQYGDDNISQLLSSRGAVGVLDFEDAFVLAPQYESVFDPSESLQAKRHIRGIHWQSSHRQKQVIDLIKRTVREYPEIDTRRIYIHGLSRGAEGALDISAKAPNLIAGALVISGRELGARQLVTGLASRADYRSLSRVPIWFFHSKGDPTAPLEGTVSNVQELKRVNASKVKYTEFSVGGVPNNGWKNESPHNSWDAVYNSPSAWSWLLSQSK